MQAVKGMFGGGKEEKKDDTGVSAEEQREHDRMGGSNRDVAGGSNRDVAGGSKRDVGHQDRDVLGGSKRDADHDVAVGLPKAGVGLATHGYTDTNVETRNVKHAVSDVYEGTEAGQDVGMKEEMVRVPVTTMQKQTVEVPETVMEQFTVTKPVTVTREVPETVRDVEMKTEMVEREEVVIDKEVVQQPTTVMKPVVTEEPRFRDERMKVNELTEELKRITVVRPRLATETVRVMRPVEVKKTVLVKRPVLVKRMVPVKAPVQVVDLVNVTQPQLSAYEKDVQVPHTEAKHVEYEKPVTVIKDAGGVIKAQESRDQRHLGTDSSRADKFKEIPVGLPFTEMVKKSKNFDVTSLHTERAAVRQTVMQPVQVERFGFEMTEAEVEVVEVDWEEVEEEVVVSELQEFEDAIKVTILDEIEEEWPVARERTNEVLTSTVTLEPRKAKVPEVGMEDVEVERPRTVTKTEAIEKAVPVEREVMVERPFTEHVEVPAERPVEQMRKVEVEQPVVHYEEKLIQTPVTVGKEVHTKEVRDREAGFKDQVAHSEAREVEYKVAEAKMKATAVPGDVAVDSDVEYAAVSDKELAKAKERHLETQPGVAAGAEVHDGYAASGRDRGVGKPKARDVAPDALLDKKRTGRRSSSSSSRSSSDEGRSRRAGAVGTDGHLVDPNYKGDIAGQMAGGPVVEGGTGTGARVGDGSSRTKTDAMGGRGVDGRYVEGEERYVEGSERVSGGDRYADGASGSTGTGLASTSNTAYSEGDESTGADGKKKKKGFLGKMKDKMGHVM